MIKQRVIEMQKYLDMLNAGNVDLIKEKLDVLKLQEHALNLMFDDVKNADYIAKNLNTLQLSFRLVADEINVLEDLLRSIDRNKKRKGVCKNSLSLVINNID